MSKKKRSASVLPRALGWLAVTAVALFVIAEVYRFARSEQGQLVLARNLGLGDSKRTATLVGGRIRSALSRAGVSGDSLAEGTDRGSGLERWRVGVEPGRSLLQLNYAVTRALENEGAAVLGGEEQGLEGGGSAVRLTVGLPMRATHELRLVRLPRGNRPASSERRGRLAIVLYGIPDDARSADSTFALPVPFAVALPPGRAHSRDVFRAAHARGREVVLHLPLEPIDYPRVHPGPGTLLVTMSPAKITSALRRDLDHAAPVAAVANHMGSLATQDMTLMRAVFHELRRADVPFVHVMPAAGAVCKSLASEMGVGYSEPDLVIDREPRQADVRAFDRRWQEAVQRARDRGACVLWIRSSPALRRWLTARAQKLEGVSLAPLSALLRKPEPI
jgi:polysaccharide deacetylase 2 family uncharacterized protein YibQ